MGFWQVLERKKAAREAADGHKVVKNYHFVPKILWRNDLAIAAEESSSAR
jgi:hypothetical protein